MTSTRRQWRRYARLAEQGRELASARDDLIAAGVDPAELPVPLHPIPPPGTGRVWLGRLPDPHEEEHLAQLARAWAIVACACIAAFAGCMSATGAALIVNNAVTWHAAVMGGMAALWAGGAIWASIYAAKLWARRRALRRPELRAVPGAHETITEVSP
jgi:DNA-binding helix-hairpin-helix protein with protein kinase domain